MALDAITNFGKATLAAGLAAGATSIVLQAGQGSKFPAPDFNAVVWDSSTYPDPADDPDVEIVRVTAILGDTLTVARGEEGTADSNHNTPGRVYKIINTMTQFIYDQIAAAFAPFSAHQIYAGPASGAPASPGPRLLVPSDLPAITPPELPTITLTGDTTGSGSGGSIATTTLETNGVPFAPSATIDTTNASNISSGSLAIARLSHFGACVVNNSNQTLPNNTDVILVYPAVGNPIADNGGFWVPASHLDRLTVPAGGAGWYIVTANVRWDANQIPAHFAHIKINGNFVQLCCGSPGGGNPGTPIAVVYFLNAGDFVQIDAFQTGVTSQNVVSCTLSLARIN